ncbi:MAG: MscL family protein, partial [Anaerolineales bacterium]
QEAGAVTMNYGAFASSIISFLVVAFALFLLVKSINRIYRKDVVAGKPK